MPNRKKPARLWLRKRKGREAVWTIRSGAKEYSTTCPEGDLQGAQEAFAKWLAKNNRPDNRQRDFSEISIAEILQLYATDVAPTRASAATIGYHIAALEPFWLDKQLSDVRGSTSRAYADFRVRQGVKPATARNELKVLQAAINYWGREWPTGYAMPVLTKPPPGEARVLCFTRADIAKMLWLCRRKQRRHVARFILIGLYTGTRSGAMLALRWNSSLVGGHIDLQRGIIYRRGSSEAETSKRRPPVQVTRRLVAHLCRWRTIDVAGGDHFVIHYAGRPIRKIGKVFAEVVKEAGLGKEYTPHILRHTCASWLLWAGFDIHGVAKMIGATAAEVDYTYGHSKLEIELRRMA